jgi:hypothetical protein
VTQTANTLTAIGCTTGTLLFPAWLQLRVRATLRSFLVNLFVPKIKLRERERVTADDELSVLRLPGTGSVPWASTFCM